MFDKSGVLSTLSNLDAKFFFFFSCSKVASKPCLPSCME